VVTGKDVGWHVTGSASTRSPFNYAIPQILFFVFLALTTVVGVWRDAENGVFTLATAWNATNTVILGAFLVAAMRESHHLRHPRERLPLAEAPVDAEPITVVARPLPLEAAEPAPASAPPAGASSRRRHRELSPTGGRS
jgi:cellulose synthase (UDP-forming)